MPVDAAYWRAGENGSVVCELCPHHCHIAEGRRGLCKVRECSRGSLVLPYFGQVSAVSIDPIEKKPLHHFLPGTEVFSAGFAGCNLRCPFCQNWRIAQEIPAELERYTPESLVAAALRSGRPSIAYTYSEPTVHFEFVLAAMAAARAEGLKNVLVTNGCLELTPARELLALTDAANVDLKTWSPEAYVQLLGGQREAVLGFIELAAELCHLEVTTLVVPGLSDSRDGMIGIAEFLARISRDIPLHLSAYHPAWKHEVPPISSETLFSLAKVARDRLRYVFVGNMAGIEADSICPSCGATVISRKGYSVDTSGMTRSGGSVTCASCGTELPIVA